jgi:hypothetical protein
MKNLKWFASFVLAAIPVSALTAETRCPGNVASVPLRFVNHYQMIVGVSVNGSGPYSFLLDTGTQFTIIDPSLAAELHLSTQGAALIAAVGSNDPASFAQLDRLEISSHAVENLQVLVFELQKMKSVELQIRGILGEDFLEHFDMLIDNAHGMLCLDDAAAMRPGLKGTHIPLLTSQTTEGAPAAKSLIIDVHFFSGMRPVRMMLDSGTNTPFLYKPTECLEIGVLQGASWHGRGVGGQQEAFVALPPQDMKIGNAALSKVPFLALRNERKELHAAAYDGLLPTGLFRRVFVSQSAEFAILELR